MGTPLENLLIGRTLVGRYEIERVLGRGGMSVVYRAMDRRLQRPVALKIVSFPSELPPEERERLRERLRREAASAASLAPHPNVVQVYDHGTDAALDLDFIAMELLPGEDLKAALRRGDLPTGEALAILEAAACGLAAGHRTGIVHRDVKPANIFLVHHEAQVRPDVKVLDFGVAKALDPGADGDLTVHDWTPHSPGYASPEQLGANRPLTAASDVFQLGLVAFEALAGERPFSEEGRARLLRGDRVPLPETDRWRRVPPHVREAVERALQPRPSDRFPDASAFANALTGDRTLHRPGDATAAAPPSDASDETVWMGAPGPATPHVPPRPARPKRRSLVPPALLATGIGLLAWLVIRPTADESSLDESLAPPAAAEEGGETPAGEILDLEALDDEFRPLLLEAYRTLREAVSAEEGEDATAAVQEVIYDVQEAWVDGDLERLLSHYADRVDFLGDDDVPVDRIRSSREDLLDRYAEREITIPHLAIEFLEPGRARALVDRSWTFDGPDDRWMGAARDEMILQKAGDRWLIVAERRLEVFAERRSRDRA